VQNVNVINRDGSRLTLRTYAVQNVNCELAGASALTKCTGNPGPPPSLPQSTFAEPADAPRNQAY
jgi:hypothetical protein